MSANHIVFGSESREVLRAATLLTDAMRCRFVDYRTDFASILADKLGNGFVLIPATVGSIGKDCDVIMVAIPPPVDSSFNRQMSALRTAAVSASGVPVVALLAASDRALCLQAFSAGAYDSFVETNTLEELRIILRRAAHFHELSKEVCADHKSVVGSFTPPPERERLCRVQRAKSGFSPA